MIQTTSHLAFLEILPTLNNRHQSVLKAFGESNFTNNELAHHLDWPINTITPRVNELVKRGLLEEFERRPCKITGRTAIVWSIKVDGQMSLI